MAIPGLLPHQVQTADGTVHGSASPLTVTVTTSPGSRAVTATSSEDSSHDVDFGVPGGSRSSLDNAESFTYAANGTYTVRMSNGRKSGSASVTVPGAAEEPAE